MKYIGTYLNDESIVTKDKLDNVKNSIPAKTSQLTNDSGYITEDDIPVKSVNGKTGVVQIDKSGIGLGNVDNVKQYSSTNPPPYPVTSVNGKTGAVTVDIDLPDGLVKYESLAPVEATTPIDANTLQGHNASYFATSSALATTNSNVSSNSSDISTLQSGLSTANTNIANKLNRSGGTMTGALVAQTNTSYTTRQVRNIIISTADPSGGSSGDIWIKYQA